MELIMYGSFKILEKFLLEFAEAEKTSYFYMHKMAAGEEVKMHYHKKADELIILPDKGAVVISLNDGKKTFGKFLDLDRIVSRVAILVKKGERYSFRTLTDIEYFVIRNKRDKTIYCQ